MPTVTITRRSSNGHEIQHQAFENATVHVKGAFVVVHSTDKESGKPREDWFSTGLVMRAEIVGEEMF